MDSAPIAAILTGRSRNIKTDRMLQLWILRTDVAPSEAKRTGLDRAICGQCPTRPSCYVRTDEAPSSIFEAFQSGSYRRITPDDLRGRPVRLGAYGDPAMLPAALVAEIVDRASMHTGYTHQWMHAHGRALRGLVMASVETRQQERTLRARDWGTFRTGARDGSDRGRTTLCANEVDGTTCLDCGKCDGGKRAIFIAAHGPMAKHAPAERKRLEVLQ